MLVSPALFGVFASSAPFATRLCCGDVEIVVVVVVAVRGRSLDPFNIAAPEEGGNFPVSSSFRILDFKSSSSSQTVEGAVVETVDSEC